MYALSRYFQANAYKLQTRHLEHRGRPSRRQLERRLEQLRDRFERQRERLRGIEASRSAGLGPRLPSALSRSRAAKELSPLASAVMRLAMTLLVRDVEDVIETNLSYHRAQGVDFFIVADNGSTDGTVAILERDQRAGLVKLEHFPGSVNKAWTEGRSEDWPANPRARRDWVIHNDGDEFWWPLTGDLKRCWRRSRSASQW